MKRIPISQALLLVALLSTAFVLSCSLNKSSDNTMSYDGQSVRDQAYSLREHSIQSVKLLCESDVFNYARSKVKDNVLRDQLANTKFIIEWSANVGMKIDVTDIPKLPDPEQHAKLMSVIDSAKDRIKGAFLMIHNVFDGFNAATQDTSAVKYEFKNIKSHRVLTNVVVSYSNPPMQHQLSINYQEIEGVLLPHKLSGVIKQGNNRQEDIITVVGATIGRINSQKGVV